MNGLQVPAETQSFPNFGASFHEVRLIRSASANDFRIEPWNWNFDSSRVGTRRGESCVCARGIKKRKDNNDGTGNNRGEKPGGGLMAN